MKVSLNQFKKKSVLNMANFYKYGIRTFLYAIILMFPSLALADLLSFAVIDENDKTIEALIMLFGKVTNVITDEELPTSPDHIVGQMSFGLNIAMLGFTGIMFTFIAVEGLLSSTQDGNLLGEKYSVLYTPARLAFASILTVPFPSGYSAMQIFILWVAGNGIGVANSVWLEALDFFKANGQIYPSVDTVDYDQIVNNVLYSRMCLQTVNKITGFINVQDRPISSDGSASGYEISDGSLQQVESDNSYFISQNYVRSFSKFDVAVIGGILSFFNFAGENRITFKEEAPCGSIRFDFPPVDSGIHSNSIHQDTLIDPISSLVSDLDQTLNNFASEVVNFRFNGFATIDERNNFLLQKARELEIIRDDFRTDFTSIKQNFITELSTYRIDSFSNPRDVEAGSLSVSECGWICAGAFFFDFQRLNSEIKRASKVEPTYKSVSSQSFSENKNLEGFDLYMNDLELIAEAHARDTNKSPQDPSLNKSFISSYHDQGDTNFDFNQQFQDIASSISRFDDIIENPDPISGLSNWGHDTINFLLVAYGISSLLKAQAEAAESGGTLPWIKAGGAFFSSLINDLIAKPLLTLMILIGPFALMAAIYLPLIPFLLWMMTVLSYFVMLILSIIAAPIWAASHILGASNDGFINSRAQAGYMILLGVFLRPILMLFGFFGSMGLIIVITNIFKLLFLPAIISGSGPNGIGFILTMGSIVIYVTTVIQFAHRSYGLIHEADNVLKYLGGGVEQLGENGGLERSQGTFIAGISSYNRGIAGNAGGGKPQNNNNGGGNNQQGGGNNSTPSNSSKPSSVDKSLN